MLAGPRRDLGWLPSRDEMPCVCADVCADVSFLHPPVRRCNSKTYQDTFNHDKGAEICNFGAPSPLDFLNFLQWSFLLFLQVRCVN